MRKLWKKSNRDKWSFKFFVLNHIEDAQTFNLIQTLFIIEVKGKSFKIDIFIKN